MDDLEMNAGVTSWPSFWNDFHDLQTERLQPIHGAGSYK
jgi:hypothetical protein